MFRVGFGAQHRRRGKCWQKGASMRAEQPTSAEREVRRSAEKIDQELAELRAAVWDLIDGLDAIGPHGA